MSTTPPNHSVAIVLKQVLQNIRLAFCQKARRMKLKVVFTNLSTLKANNKRNVPISGEKRVLWLLRKEELL